LHIFSISNDLDLRLIGQRSVSFHTHADLRMAYHYAKDNSLSCHTFWVRISFN